MIMYVEEVYIICCVCINHFLNMYACICSYTLMTNLRLNINRNIALFLFADPERSDTISVKIHILHGRE